MRKTYYTHVLWAQLHHNYIWEGENFGSQTQQRIFEAQDTFFCEHGWKNRAPCNFQPLKTA